MRGDTSRDGHVMDLDFMNEAVDGAGTRGVKNPHSISCRPSAETPSNLNRLEELILDGRAWPICHSTPDPVTYICPSSTKIPATPLFKRDIIDIRTGLDWRLYKAAALHVMLYRQIRESTALP